MNRTTITTTIATTTTVLMSDTDTESVNLARLKGLAARRMSVRCLGPSMISTTTTHSPRRHGSRYVNVYGAHPQLMVDQPLHAQQMG